MEESWYITPPPCFVSAPYETKPSSLENLLIEQPGPHFIGYVATIEKLRLLGDDKNHPTSEKCESKMTSKQKKSAKLTPKEKENSQTDDKRRMLLEVHEQRKMINTYQSQINSAQKVGLSLTKLFHN